MEYSCVPAELALVEMATPADALLDKRSAFNPYPFKAYSGLDVSLGFVRVPNPRVCIRYGSGDIYETILPTSYTEERVVLTPPLEKPATNTRWVPFLEFWAEICRQVVDSRIRNTNTEGVVALERVKAVNSLSIVPPEIAYGAIFRKSLRYINEGNWNTAISLIETSAKASVLHVRGITIDNSDLQQYCSQNEGLSSLVSALVRVAALAEAIQRGFGKEDPETMDKLFQGLASVRDHLRQLRGQIGGDGFGNFRETFFRRAASANQLSILYNHC